MEGEKEKEITIFDCEFCGKPYGTLSGRRRHTIKHHGALVKKLYNREGSEKHMLSEAELATSLEKIRKGQISCKKKGNTNQKKEIRRNGVRMMPTAEPKSSSDDDDLPLLVELPQETTSEPPPTLGAPYMDKKRMDKIISWVLKHPSRNYRESKHSIEALIEANLGEQEYDVICFGMEILHRGIFVRKVAAQAETTKTGVSPGAVEKEAMPTKLDATTNTEQHAEIIMAPTQNVEQPDIVAHTSDVDTSSVAWNPEGAIYQPTSSFISLSTPNHNYWDADGFLQASTSMIGSPQEATSSSSTYFPLLDGYYLDL